MIDPERVKEIFVDCLVKEGDDTSASNFIQAEGIRQDKNVIFHRDRLEIHKVEIENLLNELPDEFKDSGVGGMSFLNACNDKDGHQWTGFHQRMEELFQLGISIGKVKCLVPRELWSSFPGGMPYFSIVDG